MANTKETTTKGQDMVVTPSIRTSSKTSNNINKATKTKVIINREILTLDNKMAPKCTRLLMDNTQTKTKTHKLPQIKILEI